jgi:hypothetical protein
MIYRQRYAGEGKWIKCSLDREAIWQGERGQIEGKDTIGWDT